MPGAFSVIVFGVWASGCGSSATAGSPSHGQLDGSGRSAVAASAPASGMPAASGFDPSPFDPKVPPLEDGVVLRWFFEHALQGKELVEVRASGSAQVVVMDPQGYRWLSSPHFTPSELDAIAATLRTTDVCTLRSNRYGIPDEVRPTMSIRLRGIECDVTLWDGEWTRDPRASRAHEWARKAVAEVDAR